jgi:hypothetical protein
MPFTYEQWKAAVNQQIIAISGVSADDIDDFCYRDAYDAGQGFREVAIEALENAGFPFDSIEGADDSEDTHPRD